MNKWVAQVIALVFLIPITLTFLMLISQLNPSVQHANTTNPLTRVVKLFNPHSQTAHNNTNNTTSNYSSSIGR